MTKIADSLRRHIGKEVKLWNKLKIYEQDRTGDEVEGYIDHQSIDMRFEPFEDPELMDKFLFNPNSRLEIDNDNH